MSAAELALHHLVEFGHYYAIGSQGTHAPALSRQVSIALATVIQERNALARRSRNMVTSFVAQVHRGYRTHPAVQAWAEAHALGGTLRVAVFLTMDD